jgi:hypothetical protein
MCLCAADFFVNVLISVPMIIMKVEAPDALLQAAMLLRLRSKRRRYIADITTMIGMYHFETYMNKSSYREPTETGYVWVMRTLGNRTSCYNMFRMSRTMFEKLHTIFVETCGLKSTRKMSSAEALGMFLWICGAPQSLRQAENRFCRSIETCSKKFDKVHTSLKKFGS